MPLLTFGKFNKISFYMLTKLKNIEKDLHSKRFYVNMKLRKDVISFSR